VRSQRSDENAKCNTIDTVAEMLWIRAKILFTAADDGLSCRGEAYSNQHAERAFAFVKRYGQLECVQRVHDQYRTTLIEDPTGEVMRKRNADP
jgi:hypothetical protein